MCDIDLEPCAVFTQRLVKASQKAHSCDCCDGPIPIGAPYVRHFSVIDGSATHEKMCMDCDVVTREFIEEHGGASNPSYLPTLLEECIASDDDGRWQQRLDEIRERGRDEARAV